MYIYELICICYIYMSCIKYKYIIRNIYQHKHVAHDIVLNVTHP